MKKTFIYIAIGVMSFSCASVNNILGKNQICWIDTGTTILYYRGHEKMKGVTIQLENEKKEIVFQNKEGEDGIVEVNLYSVRDQIRNQPIKVLVDREGTPTPNDLVFNIDPKDWNKGNYILCDKAYYIK